MNRWKHITAVLLTVVLAVSICPMPVRASRLQYCMNLTVSVDGEEVCSIPAFDADYENQMYVSLTGLSHALRGTKKAFVPSVSRQEIAITTGETASGAEAAPAWYLWDDAARPLGQNVSAAKHKLYLDEAEKKYYSIILQHGKEYDAFLPPVCLAMLFDMQMKVSGDVLEIRTEEPFSLTADELDRSGYMQGVNAVAAGDGTTGDLYYQYDGEKAFPIASTTKLMTYFVFMDAVSQGECSLEDTASVSGNAAVLSNGPDGILSMKEGKRVPILELLHGMLIASSNECALAVAEHTAGSEAAFVTRMNAKAAELGLEHAEYYNCHGLPVYEDQLLPAKMQNHMTAEEMFVLASALLKAYPQVTEITSKKEYHMESFGKDIKNTNALLYNMDCVAGLKTGTTNKAGACLVTCASAVKDGETHYLVTVVLGADGDAGRGITSELLVRYAESTLAGDEAAYKNVLAGEDEGGADIPEDPEAVIKKLLAVFPRLSFG